MPLIDSESLLKKFESGALLFQPDVRKVIESEPEAIVRCKYCNNNPKRKMVGCPMAGNPNRKEDDYCSYWERKTDDTNR